MDLVSIKKRNVIYSLLFLFTLFTVFTYVISLATFTSPNRSLRWDSVITFSDNSTYLPGDTVNIDVFFEEGDQFFEDGDYFNFVFSEDVKWIITVYDPNNEPIHVDEGDIPDAEGDITKQFSIQIPNDGVKGIYSIKVFIWTSSLPQGNTRTRLIDEEYFEVI